MSDSTNWKALLGSAVDLLGTISPIVGAAVKAGTIAVETYQAFEESRAEIAALAAQDKVTKAQIDVLDDSIQARSKRIQAID